MTEIEINQNQNLNTKNGMSDTTEIKLNQNFTFVFYNYKGVTPSIYFNNHAGFYGVEEDVSISLDEAKQLIIELTKFVEKCYG